MPNAAMGGSGNGTSLEGFVAVSPDVIERASLLTLAHEIVTSGGPTACSPPDLQRCC